MATHTMTGHYVNGYGQVTETCSCGANSDSHDQHLIDVARIKRATDARDAELADAKKAAKAK